MTPKDKLKEIIAGFAIEKFSHFFRLKTQAQGNFRLSEEVLSYYNDVDFSDFLKLGQIEFSETEKLVLIGAKVSKNLSERSGKKAQYEKAKRILRELTAYLAGIFIFYDKDANFRFSLIYPEPVGTRRQWSNFHRFTYFVSREFTNKTFLQRIGEGDFSKLEKVKDAFSVEKVTKEFYLQYKKLFEDLVEDLLKNHTFLNEAGKNNINPENFAKKLLGQIVFLYFLQKKGWLGVPAGEKWGTGDKNFISGLFQKAERAGVNFYNDYLEKLFYDALNNPRRDSADPSYYKPFDCRIPFLNGGLFESEYNWKNSLMYLNNTIFKRIFDVFDRYNFTVEEESPDDKEVAIDPEMLGKVFENLLEENLRKGKGTYYTPREIVQYMCQESLVNYLVSHHSNITEQNIRDYMFYAKSFENFSEQKTESFTFGQYKELDNLLRNIRVVDPACGSGAFLVGMLKEIVRLRLFLQTTPDYKVILPKSEYQLKKETIQNCIFGVDIDPGAVEIAKLRLWLSLVVDYELEEIEPLPNLDYKIILGNSLIDKAIVNGTPVKIFDLSYLEKTEHAVRYKNLFEIEPQEELFSSQKKKEITSLVGQFITKKQELFKESDLERKDKLRREINMLENKIIRISLKEELEKIKGQLRNKFPEGFFLTTNQAKEKLDLEFQEEFLSKLMKDDKELDKYKHKNIFLWHLNFIEIFREKGGFDVVIANPPYGANIDEDTRRRFKVATKEYHPEINRNCYNSEGIFIEQGINLLQQTGTLTYIIPNNIARGSSFEKIRTLILEEAIVRIIVDEGNPFESVTLEMLTVILQKRKNATTKNKINILSRRKGFDNFNNIINQAIFQKYRRLVLYYDDLFEKLTKDSLMNVVTTSGNLVIGSKYLTQEKKNDLIPVITGKSAYKYVIRQNGLEYVKRNNLDDRHLEILDKELLATTLHINEFRVIVKPIGYTLGESSVYLIFNENLFNPRFMMGILNSHLINFHVRRYIFNNSFLTFDLTSPHTRFIPIKKLALPQQKPFIDLVDKILAITKNSDYLENSTKQAKVREYEKQIDQLVYNLYGFTPEEIEIVEGKR